MASLATSSILPLLVLLAAAVAADAATFTITNKCAWTVWPAALPTGVGRQLEPGESWAITMPAGTKNGRIWARTGCGFISGGNLGQCQTGDCGGTVECKVVGAPPVTLAEFSLNQGKSDFFDISLVDGFNSAMAFLPAGGARCSRGGPQCKEQITLQCPGELRAKAGCSNPCRGKSNCGPTKDTQFFKMLCPETFTYAEDNRNTIYTCPAGTDYKIVFCP